MALDGLLARFGAGEAMLAPCLVAHGRNRIRQIQTAVVRAHRQAQLVRFIDLL
jgi:hypothetical protein